jgi:hypothetical protein
MENMISGIFLMILGLLLFVLTQLKPRHILSKLDKFNLSKLLHNENMAITLYLVSVTFVIGGLLVIIDII